MSCQARPLGIAQVGQKERLSVGWMDMCMCSGEWPSRAVEVGTIARLSVGRLYMLFKFSGKQSFGGPIVAEEARLRVSVCRAAAENGHLGLLQWIRRQCCPWDKWTCSLAAKNGHLEVLKWAREQGCPWDGYVCYYAAKKGHVHKRCNGRVHMAAHGMKIYAPMQQRMATWTSCNGPESKAVHGINAFACVQRKMATWDCWSRHKDLAAPGTGTHALWQQSMVITDDEGL